MRTTVVTIITVLFLAIASQAAIVENFESYTPISGYPSVQSFAGSGWSGNGWGQLGNGGPYIIAGTTSMYTNGGGSVQKAWAGSGAVFADQTNVSFLSRFDGVSNAFCVSFATNITSGAAMTFQFKDTAGTEQINVYYNGANGWDYYATSLPGWGGTFKTYKLELEANFATQTVSVYGTPFGGARTFGGTYAYDIGTAADMAAIGGIIFGGGNGGMIVDDIAVTPIPEPATIALLGIGYLAFRKRK